MSGPIAGAPAMPAEPRSTGPSTVGPLDLYRVIAAEVTGAARGRLMPVVAGILVLAHFALRTLDADPMVLRLWLAATTGFALLSPSGGLLVLAAIAPFNEGVPVTRDLGSKTVLAVALTASVGGRWAIDRIRHTGESRVYLPVVLAVALLIATGLGLLRTWDRWGPEFAQAAAQIWGQGVATMLLVFVASVAIARRGAGGPILVTVLATTAAGLISLADFAGDATIRETPIAWIVAGPYSPLRLTGVIRSPTSTAALIMIPLAIYLTAMILGQDRRLRLVSVLASVPLLVAAYLTYNRAVFLALIVWLVIVGWRIRRALGIALFALALVGSLVFIPWYISARGAAVGPISQAPPGQVLIASDQMRLTAWEAALRMFLDEPILGQGYRAYRQLSVEFGDPTLNAPHNEWLRFFAEHGFVVGLLAIAFAVATALALARRSDWLATGILIAFLATCLAASFNNPFLFNQVMIPAFVLAGCGLAMAERSARADAAPSAEFGSPLREVV